MAPMQQHPIHNALSVKGTCCYSHNEIKTNAIFEQVNTQKIITLAALKQVISIARM